MTFLEKYLEDPVRLARVKRWSWIGLAALAVIEVAALLLLYPDHGHFWFEDFPAWGALYGLASCVVIIVVSKFVGKLWLVRRETYFDS